MYHQMPFKILSLHQKSLIWHDLISFVAQKSSQVSSDINSYFDKSQSFSLFLSLIHHFHLHQKDLVPSEALVFSKTPQF